MKTPKQLCGRVRAAWTAEARAIPLVRGVCIVVALGLSAGFVGSAAAHGSGAASAAGSVTFSDPAGDAGPAAPDIGSVTINGDAATGAITAAVTAAGYLPASPDGQERDIDVFLDTDKNGSTGSTSGSEYVLAESNDSTGSFWDMGRWDLKAQVLVPRAA